MHLPLLFLAAALLLPSYAQADGCEEDTLIEYSYGRFADGDDLITGPMLWPPVVKIFRNGRVIFYESGGVWEGRVRGYKLNRLVRYLSLHPMLDESGIVEVNHGSIIGIHGGMAYLRYCGSKGEIIKGAMRNPTGGDWARILEQVRRVIPKVKKPFVPTAFVVDVWETSRTNTVPWPFGDRYDLSELSPDEPEIGDEIEIRDPDVIRFLAAHLQSGFSWLQVPVEHDGQSYRLMIEGAPPWYSESSLHIFLGFMADDWHEATGG